MKHNTLIFSIIVTILCLIPACSSEKDLLEKELGPFSKYKNNAVYSIIMIPDTQRYFRAKSGPDIFQNKINWITKWSKTLNVRFITHIGDVIEDGMNDINHKEWKESHKILSALDNFSKKSLIPYSISLGDHDYNGNERPDMGYTGFVKYYGKKRYKDFKWYGGSSNTETSHFQFFTANGRKILHINLECDAPRNTAFPKEEDQLKWAQSIINKYPGIPVLLSTHAYITDEAKNGKFIGHEPSPEVKKKNRRKGENRRGGVEIWKELVSQNDAIFMVLCGNYHEFNNRKGDTGEYHQVSKNNKGRSVVEILANYQGYPNGGDGLFRIITMDEINNKIIVKTYSTYHKKFRKKMLKTPRTSEFIIPFNFKKRLSL